MVLTWAIKRRRNGVLVVLRALMPVADIVWENFPCI